MPVELHIIRASEFICLDANEHLDLEASKQVLRSLALALRKRAICCAMIDLRSLPVLSKPHFTKTELAALVRSFREAGFSRDQRLAVLYAHDIYGGIRDFAFLGRMSGLQVQAFVDFEAAFQWLSEAQQRVAEPQPGQAKVPVRLNQIHPRKLSVDVIAAEPGPGATRSKENAPSSRRSPRR
jgi:hypothetical protein